jgi:tetratricopeptide (TPR) repeat protein
MSIIRHWGVKPELRIILYLPAILILIVLTITAIRWSLADVYATQVTHHLDTVNVDSSNKNAGQWRLARQYLDRTLALRPAYGRYFELAETFYQVLDSLESDGNPLIQELSWRNNAFEALDNADRGLRLTPSWPYLWRQLALSKLALKQFDDKLTGAFERAIHLGPWEREVQYDVAVLGLDDWPNLKEETRFHVVKAMEQSLMMDQIRPDKFYDIKQVCEQFGKDMSSPQLFRLCPANGKQGLSP